MLKETVNAPRRFTTSIVAKKANEVHNIPRNTNQRKSLMVIVNKSSFKSPVNKSTTLIKMNPINNSQKVIVEEGISCAKRALKTENSAAQSAEVNPYANASKSSALKSLETK